MKKIIFLFAILSVAILNLNAQVIDTLSTDKEGFMKDLKQQFDATNKSDLKDLYKDFESQVKLGKISDAVLDKLIYTSNQMLIMRGKAYQQLQQTLKSYMELKKQIPRKID